MTVTYKPPQYETYAQLKATCQTRGIAPHDELQRFSRAYGETQATQLWFNEVAKTILEKSHDTQGREQEAWQEMLMVLKRNHEPTLSSKLYWLKCHAHYAGKRSRSKAKREVYAWCEQTCKPIRAPQVGLCVHCGYDRVYGTGCCCNCGEQFNG